MPELLGDLKNTTAYFLRGLRKGTLLIATAVLVTAALFRNLSAYHPLATQLIAFATDLALVVTEVVLLTRNRPWGVLRWPGLATAYTAAVLSEVTLPHGASTTALDWVYGTTGWMGAVLLLQMPIGYLVGFLLLHEATTVVVVVLSAPTEITTLNVVVAAVGALGFPFGTALGATALRNLAKQAHHAAAEAAAIISDEAVQDAILAKRQERFTDLRATASPLLRALADGSGDPDDPAFQRACAIEAARMRRLFAEVDDVSDPFWHELEHCADIADRRGVLVDMARSGTYPPIPLDVRRALTDGLLVVLATARTRARITVFATPGRITVCVIADCETTTLPDVDATTGILRRTIHIEDELCMEATWAFTTSQL